MAQSIADIKRILYNSLADRSLGRVMAQLTLLADASHHEQLLEMQQSYKTLLQYYFDGVDDPERENIFRHLLRQCYEMTDDLCAAKTTRLSSEHPIWAALWLPLRYTEEETQAFARYLKGGSVEACMAVSATTLNHIELFDEPKMECLFEAAVDPRPEVSGRAWVGLMLTLAVHSRRLEFHPNLTNRLTLLLDQPDRVQQCQTILKQLILSKETESIARDIQDNILPVISKLAPQIKKHTGRNNLDDEQNDLQDLLDQNGIGDKMQEYTERQMEGMDINYSTFSQLKHFSFFHKMENWLVPFDTNHPEIAVLFGLESKQLGNVVKMLLDNDVMCDSDKYSFYLNIAQIPIQLRKQLAAQLQAETEQIKDMQTTTSRDALTNRYIQDLYRFCHLYPGHDKITNVFQLRFDFHKSPLFRLLNPGGEFLLPWADYLLKHGFTEYAVSAYTKLEELGPPDAGICRKAGYCCQRNGLYTQAVDYYRKAELIEPDDAWTQFRLAACLLKEGRSEEALALYDTLDAAHPNHWRYLLPKAVCEVKLGHFETARELFYKLEYLFPDKVETSDDYHLYLGHCCWMLQDRKAAVGHYAQACKREDLEEELRMSGLPFSEMDLVVIIDYLRYNNPAKGGPSPS